MKKLAFSIQLSVISFLFLAGCTHFNPDNGPIRLNQLGFAPEQEKTATITLSDERLAVSEVFVLTENGDTIPLTSHL